MNERRFQDDMERSAKRIDRCRGNSALLLKACFTFLAILTPTSTSAAAFGAVESTARTSPSSRRRTLVRYPAAQIGHHQRRSPNFSRPPASCNNFHSNNLLVLRGGAGASLTPASPKLIQWITPALSSALSFGLYNIFIKLGSESVHPILGGVVLQFVAALLGSIMLGVSKDTEKFRCDRKGLIFSICAGLAVGVAEILSFTVSGMGAKASQSIPLTIGGSVVFGSVLGFLVLHERLTIRGWFGVFLVVMGIVCVATDPGSQMGH